jgi:hypothetical protein
VNRHAKLREEGSAGNGRRIREEKPKPRASRGEGPGKSGTANASEPLINVVKLTEPKALIGSSPKGEQPGSRAEHTPGRGPLRCRRKGGAYPAHETCAEQGKPVRLRLNR